jgi:hypothetical protein
MLVFHGLFVISKNSWIEVLSPGVLAMVQPRKSRLLPLKRVVTLRRLCAKLLSQGYEFSRPREGHLCDAGDSLKDGTNVNE